MINLCQNLALVDGIRLSPTTNADVVRSGLNYKAQTDDIFLSTYPKAGTTWMKTILYSLLNDGKAFDDDTAEYFAHSPMLEKVGKEGIDKIHRPYVINTHLPLDRLFDPTKAKYVCVIRNPKDVCVSFYYFLLKIYDEESDKASFETYFEEFINGNVPYDDYFQHLHTVWKHKDYPNVFVTSYEEMKHDYRSIIRQLAQFLNVDLTDDLLERIVACTSFEYMKERYDKAARDQARIALANGPSGIATCGVAKHDLEIHDKYVLVRKGVVNGWSSIMNDEQAHRLDQIFNEKTVDIRGVEKRFQPAETESTR